MGGGGAPSGGITRVDSSRLSSTGTPNSRADRYRNGQLMQQRWYGPNGRAKRNRDFRHQGNMGFPHDHRWDWRFREPRRPEHLDPSPDFF